MKHFIPVFNIEEFLNEREFAKYFLRQLEKNKDKIQDLNEQDKEINNLLNILYKKLLDENNKKLSSPEIDIKDIFYSKEALYFYSFINGTGFEIYFKESTKSFNEIGEKIKCKVVISDDDRNKFLKEFTDNSIKRSKGNIKIRKFGEINEYEIDCDDIKYVQ